VQVAVAVCVTVKILPAIVSVPVRLAPELLVATMNVTVPFPFPGPALSTATQATLLSASHAHVDAAVTTLLPNPPSDVNDPEVGETELAQPAAAPCVTVKVVPAIVSVPVRAAAAVLGATLNATLPEPVPLLPDVMVIQEALLLASHPQSDVVVTVVLPAPPSAANPWVVGEVLNVQPWPP